MTDLPTEDELNSMLQPEQKEKQESELEVLKELFKRKEIETKTELSPQQIVLINQKRQISKLLDWKSLNDALDDFMLLQVSLARRGRSEFVDGFKSDRQNKIESKQGLMGNIKDKLGLG